MHETKWTKSKPADLATPVRNRYYYGKLLDVFHFELETKYLNDKRWLLNRLVTGYGVVCGLDVQLAKDGRSIWVTCGLAIDRLGREMIVPTDSGPYPFPSDLCETNGASEKEPKGGDRSTQETRPERKQEHYQEQQPEEEECDLHIVLCYHECQTNPTPVLTGECSVEQLCAASMIEERFRIEFRPGQAPQISVWDCHIPDAITRGELDYEILVRWVTDNKCCEIPDDPCIPLANVRLTVDPDGPYCRSRSDIDINVRPIALSNEVLFYLLMSMLFEATPRRRSR